MIRTPSLRARLTAIILFPLLGVATLAGLWQLNNARRTATDVFDRSLLSAALAVVNDVTISGGDALSPSTRDILTSTSGGLVYYHVYAPDGVIVAGYATPPVGIPRPDQTSAGPTYFNARYLGQAVRGVRLQNTATIDGFSGVFTSTVWQESAVRTAFVRDLVMRSLITIGGLILCVAVIVRFGVRFGLRPLLDLESAIARRSSNDLSPIRRAVPEEVEGIVKTLNRVFGQVSRSMQAQSQFIANAAHQLRNPIAGVLSLAEAVNTAPDEAECRRRAADLVDAARQTADLSQKLLLLERAESISPASSQDVIDLEALLTEWVAAYRADLPPSLRLSLSMDAPFGATTGDATMLREAIVNLLDNACRHGGADLSAITVCAGRVGDEIVVDVCDNGQGLPDGVLPEAADRFVQLAPTSSSGLGLSIVRAVAASHGGTLALRSGDNGFCATLRLPSVAV